MQLRLDVPDGMGSVTITYSLEAFFGIEPIAGVIVRRDAPIEFEYEQTPDEMQVDSVHDEQTLDLGAGSIDIEVEGAQTLYVAFVNQTNTVLRVGDFALDWHEGAAESDGDSGDGGVDDTGSDGGSDGAVDGTSGASVGDDGGDATTTSSASASDGDDVGGDDVGDDDGGTDGTSESGGSQDDGAGGCGCTAASPRSAWLLVGGLAFARRRRR
jgi:hypothetical protein